MDDADRPIHTLTSSAGMGTLQPDQFEPVLLELLQPFLHADRVLQLMCCGMVGARQGWSDAGYLQTPLASAQQTRAHPVDTRDARIRVHILPGVAQSSPADVMRGEETQIAGLLHQNTQFCGTACLPGTHTKWVRIDNACLENFQTCMSGELFALLGSHSVLRHSMQTEDWSEQAFDTGAADALAAPEKLSAMLFSLRAEGLLNGVGDAELRSRLSGLLLGVELAATRDYWQSRQVTIIGDDRLSGLYARALSLHGGDACIANGDELTLAGLIAAYHHQGA